MVSLEKGVYHINANPDELKKIKSKMFSEYSTQFEKDKISQEKAEKTYVQLLYII